MKPALPFYLSRITFLKNKVISLFFDNANFVRYAAYKKKESEFKSASAVNAKNLITSYTMHLSAPTTECPSANFVVG